ncbi:uncharacterized protein [Rutidosis leptorrhynchoides]|uniref:uncharacterized protein n=1 Tax=Rutidosis leptorrhynchoides TaxID=125765 RepID=UPI003A99A5F1
MKLWERVIEKRLRLETTVLENQFGFMPGHSSMEAIHIIRSLTEKYREKQKCLEMAFLDLEKAYDCVPRKLIWKTLNARGIPSRYIRAIVDMCGGGWGVCVGVHLASFGTSWGHYDGGRPSLFLSLVGFLLVVWLRDIYRKSA